MYDLLKERYDFFMNVEELAELLRITKQTVYARLSRGDFPIPYAKLGKQYLFATQDVANFLSENRTYETARNSDHIFDAKSPPAC